MEKKFSSGQISCITPFMNLRFTLMLLLVSIPSTLCAIEPDPFRGDEWDGRDFNIGETYFLDQFSYRRRVPWIEEWENNRHGFYMTGGSTSSDDLWIDSELRKTLDLDEHFVADIRFERKEDFNDRYDRFLVGLGYRLAEQWALTLLGDVHADKEDIDLQWELTREDGEGNRFRLAFIMVNYLYNSKSDEDNEYEKYPYTFFAEWRFVPQHKYTVHAWINWNSEMELEDETLAQNLTDEQLSGGAYIRIPLAEALELWSQIQWLEEERKSRTDAGPLPGSPFDRNYSSIEAELRHPLNEQLLIWGGARYVYLDEDGLEQTGGSPFEELKKNETIIHTGVEWKLADRWLVWPGVYVDILDDHQQDVEEEGESWRSSATIGKAMLPIEYTFDQGARFVFNTGMEFPNVAFGGFNLQFQALF